MNDTSRDSVTIETKTRGYYKQRQIEELGKSDEMHTD